MQQVTLYHDEALLSLEIPYNSSQNSSHIVGKHVYALSQAFYRTHATNVPNFALLYSCESPGSWQQTSKKRSANKSISPRSLPLSNKLNLRSRSSDTLSSPPPSDSSASPPLPPALPSSLDHSPCGPANHAP